VEEARLGELTGMLLKAQLRIKNDAIDLELKNAKLGLVK